jgi:hypothetical protein
LFFVPARCGIYFCILIFFLFFRFLGLVWWWFLPRQNPLKNRTDEGWEEKKGKRVEKQATQGFAGEIPIVENFVCCECRTTYNT